MAWEDYGDKIRGGCRACYDGWEGRYTIPQAGAFLNYVHADNGGDPEVRIQGIYTHPSDRGDGVAEALIRRLSEDHPGVRINPGYMTQDGQKFHDRMVEKEPSARSVVTAGRNGDLPPLTFEPFNTFFSNGIMARHAADGRPVGHLHWVPRGEIDSVTVHPELQRRGIGSAMLDHARSNPDQYPSTYPIHHSQHLTTAGRAWAAADGHTPPEETIYKADDNTDNWGYTAVDRYTPTKVPYNGQNEDEMSSYLEQPWTPPTKTAAASGDGWPVWWNGRHRPAGDFDDRWSPNHPHHIPGPWEA
jgi:ribosomal protein S18 acetylase RimI-like enzyme